MGIAENLQGIHERMAEAAERVNRDPASIKLLAVSKTVPVEQINDAIRAGVDCIGENRVQEFLQKEGALLPCRRDFIGTLQSNKAAKLAGKVTMVHSLSKVSTAEALNKAWERVGEPLDVLLQVNVGGEASKDGVSPNEAEAFLETVLKMKYLQPVGLMTVPPISEGEEARHYFSLLRKLLENLRWVSDITGTAFDQLSMGMSHDYMEAIMEGATIVRVGSAIFGTRT